MITDLITAVIGAATDLLGSLTTVFDDVFTLIYTGGVFTSFGDLLVGAAGFALAWAGINFILTYVGKLLNASRGGRR